MRPKSTAHDLPPRMLRRTKVLKSGKVWAAYYYNGRDEDGKRKEIPLGSDPIEAKRKWAELECKPAPIETGLMKVIFDRYERDVIPSKAPRTQIENLGALKHLRPVFNSAPVDAITPQHIAQYRDKRTAKVSANREISLLSHIWNMAREWGYTAKENICRGVKNNKETGRDFYVDTEVWAAVYNVAPQELRDAMDLAYLTGQRPADVRRMRFSHVREDALDVEQNKTGKKLRIQLTNAQGQRSALGALIDTIRSRPRTIASVYVLSTVGGQPLSYTMIRNRFDDARIAAAKEADQELAERIKKFQFRDIRARAASDIDDLQAASKLLGHAGEKITASVYRRSGEKVSPTR